MWHREEFYRELNEKMDQVREKRKEIFRKAERTSSNESPSGILEYREKDEQVEPVKINTGF